LREMFQIDLDIDRNDLLIYKPITQKAKEGRCNILIQRGLSNIELEGNRGLCDAGPFPYQDCIMDDNPIEDGKVLLDGKCEHKELFNPPGFMDYFGTFMLIVLMALATMGGIGGGGVVVLLI
jgi:hypothetical protein